VKAQGHPFPLRMIVKKAFLGLKEQNFDGIQSYIEDTGEVNWLVQDAINKEIPIPIISQSVMELFKSRIKDSDTSQLP
jgi:6-phosphogluconate dehydrogenase